MYAVHPRLVTAVNSPDVNAAVRITLAAWQRRLAHVQHKSQKRNGVSQLDDSVTPTWISDLCQKFDLPAITSMSSDLMMQEPVIDPSHLLPSDFDFDSMDWSFWENSYLDGA